MTKEDKELLLKYLCMALPYGVKILHEGWNYEWDDELSTIERVVGIDEKWIYTKVIDKSTGEEYREDSHSIDLFDDKPYLNPLSNITKDEFYHIASIIMQGLPSDIDIEKGTCTVWVTDDDIVDFSLHDMAEGYYGMKGINWLLEKHFDFMGMIEKGLAIEVTEENNPYV